MALNWATIGFKSSSVKIQTKYSWRDIKGFQRDSVDFYCTDRYFLRIIQKKVPIQIASLWILSLFTLIIGEYLLRDLFTKFTVHCSRNYVFLYFYFYLFLLYIFLFIIYHWKKYFQIFFNFKYFLIYNSMEY